MIHAYKTRFLMEETSRFEIFNYMLLADTLGHDIWILGILASSFS